MKTITIIRQLSTTIAMLLVHIHVHAVNGFGGLDGSDRSCYCGQFTNLLICEDPDDKQICFCNEDGNVYCDKKVPDDIIDEPAPPVQELAELLLVAEIYTVDGCFCDDVTNVLSCDHPLKEEYCFCNEDGGTVVYVVVPIHPQLEVQHIQHQLKKRVLLPLQSRHLFVIMNKWKSNMMQLSELVILCVYVFYHKILQVMIVHTSMRSQKLPVQMEWISPFQSSPSLFRMKDTRLRSSSLTVWVADSKR
jgi:hypothetical protein